MNVPPMTDDRLVAFFEDFLTVSWRRRFRCDACGRDRTCALVYVPPGFRPTANFYDVVEASRTLYVDANMAIKAKRKDVAERLLNSRRRWRIRCCRKMRGVTQAAVVEARLRLLALAGDPPF